MPGTARVLTAAVGLLAVLAVLTASGCTPAPEPDPAEPTATPTPEPTPEEVGTPAPEHQPRAEPQPAPRAPLTGREVDDPKTLERPVIAVKVDDADAALPQVGLEIADIVFTEVIEGGTTRSLALFHGEEPGEVGPVRSARPTDADLLPAFDGLLAVSDASPGVLERLRAADVELVEEGQPPEAWRRQPERAAPHNVFAAVDDLWEALAALEEDAEPTRRARRPWPIAEDREPAPSGTETSGVRLTYSRAAQASWAWDPDVAAWQRARDGEVHRDEEGAPLEAQNVVVARVSTSLGPRTDAAGAATVESDLLRGGPALVLRGGQAVEGRWERDLANEPFRFLTEHGRPIELKVGTTWLELVPESGSVEVVPAG